MADAAEVIEDEIVEPEVPEVPEEPEVPEVSDEDKAYEDRARRMGWRPLEEYGGNKARWVDARTFVQRGETELPILRERFRKMDTELVSTQGQVKELTTKLQESAEVLTELRDLSRTSEDRAYRRAMAELQNRERQAVREADEATYNQVQVEKAELVAPPAAPRREAAPARPVEPAPAPAAIRPNPVIEQWVAENSWYQSDHTLHMYARDMDVIVERDHPGWEMSDKLAEVKRRVMAKFPEKFDNPRRVAPAAVAASSAPAPRPKGKTLKDLPPEARAAFVKFKKQMPNYTEKEYVDMYLQGE